MASRAHFHLGLLPGGSFSLAVGVNNRGQIAGHGDTAGADTAFRWRGGFALTLNPLPGGRSTAANGISPWGQVVGRAMTPPRCLTPWSGNVARPETSGRCRVDCRARRSAPTAGGRSWGSVPRRAVVIAPFCGSIWDCRSEVRCRADVAEWLSPSTTGASRSV